MKNLIKLSLVISGLAPLAALAQAGITPVQPVQNINLQNLINSIAGWATGLLIALSVLFVIYAAFLYLTAAGSSDNIDQAKNIIIYAVIGIVVALLAQVVKTIAFAIVGQQ